MLDVDDEDLMHLTPERNALLAIQCARLALGVREADLASKLALRTLDVGERAISAEPKRASALALELHALLLEFPASDRGLIRGTNEFSPYPFRAARLAARTALSAATGRVDALASGDVLSASATSADLAIRNSWKAMADAHDVGMISKHDGTWAVERLVRAELDAAMRN